MKKFLSTLLALAMVLTMLPAAVFAASVKYIVAGDPDLCGSTWDGSDLNNAMSIGIDYLYSITYRDVPVREGYQFKIVENASDGEQTWHGDVGDTNWLFNVTVECDVTIKFDPMTGKVQITGVGVDIPSKLDIDSITAVGAGSGSFLNGASWDIYSSDNIMTETSTDVYQISYQNVEAGDYDFKFTSSGSWVHNWGYSGAVESGTSYAADYNGTNIYISVPEDGSTVTLTLDLSGFDYNAKTGATFSVQIAVPAEASIKFQTKTNGNSADLRLVTWVDSLDYAQVYFNVTIGGQTAAIPCTTVYSSINAGGVVLGDASAVFGEEAQYFVTYTIKGIPSSAYYEEIQVSVTWTDLEGNSVTSKTRTVVLADVL